jgi:catechol 2,3-dioxygenase
MYKEPILDVAQLAHVEIYSTDIEESVKFIREILGMEESHIAIPRFDGPNYSN